MKKTMLLQNIDKHYDAFLFKFQNQDPENVKFNS